MTGLSLGEVFFLALGVGGFARFGWCLVWLIGTEAPMPSWLELALNVFVGFVLGAVTSARRQAMTAAALAALLTPTAPEATR